MDKLAVVSGGTKGIGRAVVEKFASHGFHVATCARSEQELDELARHVRSTYLTEIFTCQADLSRQEDVARFAQLVHTINRPIALLVNNAGYFAPGTVSEGPDGLLEYMMNVNLFSAYYLTRALLEPMKKNGAGHLFFLCSVASLQAYAGGGLYSTSKFALLGLSKALRQELLGSGIRVTSVMPGATLTASWEGTELPESRFMRASDVADVIYAAYALSGNSVVEDITLRPQLGDL